MKNQKPGRKKGVPGKDSDSSSSSSSSDDKNEKDQKAASSDDSSRSSSSDDDPTNEDRPSKKKKKKPPNMNSLFLGTHSLAIRFATLDDSACASKEDWMDSDGQSRKRIRKRVQDDKC